MSKSTTTALIALAIAVAFGPTTAAAGNLDEGAPTVTCFYECKPGPTVDGKPTWREITTLMLGNPGKPREASITIYDGNSNLVTATETFLDFADLDELNICATLRNAATECSGPGGYCEDSEDCCFGFCDDDECSDPAATTNGAPPPGPAGVPEAGLVRIMFGFGDKRVATTQGQNEDPPGGPPPPPVNVWVKNLLGRFFVERDEPFEGRVTGIAKTQCQIGPPSEPYILIPRPIPPVLVENTGEDEGRPCGAAEAPQCNGACEPGFECEELAQAQGAATTNGVADCICRPD